jgi:hypothetical protein
VMLGDLHAINELRTLVQCVQVFTSTTITWVKKGYREVCKDMGTLYWKGDETCVLKIIVQDPYGEDFRLKD